MATLTGNTIKDTYKSLIKVNDNGELAASLQEITDGYGNGSGVSLNTAGDLKAEGTIEFGSIKDTAEDITITKFVDEADGIANNDNDTTIPTSAAIVDYVASRITLEDLDFAGDTGTGSVDLDGQVFTIAGGTGLDTTASGQTLTVNIDSTVATLTGTQTLTNKSIDADSNTITNLEVDNLKSGVLDTDLTTVSTLDDTLASAKAIKTYVDANITAQDLDITDGTTTSAVDLDSQTMTIQGTANEVEVSLTDQTFTVGLPDTINVNVTGAVTGNADTASTLQTARDIALSGDVAGSASFDGSANITISTTIQADSVALGTDTTGDYVANLGTGTGVTIASNTGEGSQPTIAVDYGSTANTAVQGNTEITINGTTNEIEITGTANQALGGAPSYTIGLPDDVTIGGSLIVSNDLTVNGTTTTVNTQTLSVEDPLIALAIANDANSVDTGFYAKYSLDSGVTTKFAGLFKDASDTDTFKLFKGLETEPTTTVDTSGTGYALADLDIAALSASSGVISGDLTVDTNTLYVDSTNNRVGIGTVSPNVKLMMVESGTSTASTLSLIGTNTSGAASQVSHISSYQPSGGSSQEAALDFKVRSSTDSYASPSTVMTLLGTGRVGIGTDTPSSLLEIQTASTSGDADFQIFSRGESPNYEVFKISRSAGSTELLANQNLTLSADYDNNHTAVDSNIVFKTDNAERLKIDSSGVVQVRNQTPTIQLYNTDTAVTLNQTLGDIDWYQSDPSDQGVGTVAKIRAVNVGSIAGYGELAFHTGGATSIDERLRIDYQGRVGINCSPSGVKFQVNQSVDNQGIALSNSSRGSSRILWELAGATNEAHYFKHDNGTNIYGMWYASRDQHSFLTGDTERLKIDSNGNVGVSVTPSAWSAGNFIAQQIGVGASIAGRGSAGTGDQIYISANTYYDGTTWRYIETNPASNYYQDNGEHVWRTAVNGSAGVATTFSERMRIDNSGKVGIGGAPTASVRLSTRGLTNTSSDYAFEAANSSGNSLFLVRSDGNVGIGSTSPSAKLTIDRNEGSSAATTFTTANSYLQLGTTSYNTSGAVYAIGFGYSGGATNSPAYIGLKQTDTGSYTKGDLVFLTRNSTNDIAPTERMRITSGGNVLFGGISNFPSSTQAGFGITGTSSGNASSSGTSTSAYNHLMFYNGNGLVGYISTSGSATAYNTSSDYRLKENVVELTDALDRIDALKPSRFNFIADPDKTVDGFLAHEVADVVPEAITGEKDAMRTEEYEVSPAIYEDVVHPAVEEVLDEDGNVVTPAQEEYTEKVLVSEAVMGTREVPEYQGIDQSKLVPVLTAALQEAHALIKDLTARVEALESN